MDIRDLDLNLLPILDALLRKRSVTLAARELHLSQSALSGALARLRAALGDNLFVRTRRGLLPTPRALELAPVVSTILTQVRDNVLTAGSFDPATAQRRFTLCLSDVGGYVLWPAITTVVARQAPGANLHLKVLGQPEIASGLESGELDLAIGDYPGLPDSYYQKRLFDREYVAVVRRGHRLADKSLQLPDLTHTPHVVVRLASGIQEYLDRTLAEHGLHRRVAAELPSYLMLPPLLEQTDYLSVMPIPLFRALAERSPLISLPLPIPAPRSTVRLYWHRRFHGDPANLWLRTLVTQSLSLAKLAQA